MELMEEKHTADRVGSILLMVQDAEIASSTVATTDSLNSKESKFYWKTSRSISCRTVEISDNNRTPSFNVADASSGNIVDVAHWLQRDFDDNDVSIGKPFDHWDKKITISP